MWREGGDGHWKHVLIWCSSSDFCLWWRRSAFLPPPIIPPWRAAWIHHLSKHTHARQPHRRATNKPWLCFQWLSKLKRTECESDCSCPLSYIYWLNCGQSLWSVSPHLQCLTWGTHRATCLYPAPCYAAFVKGNLPGGELTESGRVVQRDESRVEFIEGGKIRRMRSKWTRPAERPAQAQTPSLAM